MISDPFTTALAVGFVVALLVAAGLGWACYRLLVDRGHLLLRLEGSASAQPKRNVPGLRAGAYLPDFALPACGGGIVTLSGLARRSLLLVFVRPDCLYSRAFVRELAADDPDADAPLPVLIVSGQVSDFEDCHPFGALPGWVLFDPPGQVAQLLRVTATPSGYLTDGARRTIGNLLMGPAALLAAASGAPVSSDAELPQAVTPMSETPTFTLTPLLPGAIAPDFTLPMVAGGEWSLSNHRGAPLTLVFTDPACPPCENLVAKLGEHNAAGIVLVSRGDSEANRQVAESTGLKAPVLVQQHREVARAFRVLETPAAYRLDASGVIAAGPAIGADDVLALITRRSPLA